MLAATTKDEDAFFLTDAAALISTPRALLLEQDKLFRWMDGSLDLAQLVAIASDVT